MSTVNVLNNILDFFDNNQVVGKTHHVTLISTVKSSTITTLIHIHARHTHNIQADPHLSPSVWLQDSHLDDHQTTALDTLHEESEEALRY